MQQFAKTRQYGDSAAFVPPLILPQPGSSEPGGSGTNYQPVGDVNSLPAARVTEPQRYGETVLINSTSAIAAANGGLILNQPATVRVLLMIQNNDTVNDLWVNFGATAAVNKGLRLAAGGVAFYDAFVPQDEINVFGAISVPFALHYANKALV